VGVLMVVVTSSSGVLVLVLAAGVPVASVGRMGIHYDAVWLVRVDAVVDRLASREDLVVDVLRCLGGRLPLLTIYTHIDEEIKCIL
jgi:hypothetical protein